MRWPHSGLASAQADAAAARPLARRAAKRQPPAALCLRDTATQPILTPRPLPVSLTVCLPIPRSQARFPAHAHALGCLPPEVQRKWVAARTARAPAARDDATHETRSGHGMTRLSAAAPDRSDHHSLQL